MTENNEDERREAHPDLMAYIALYRRIYERMERENSFPWSEEEGTEDNTH